MSSEGRHYQVMSVLGRGGFGTVYRARLSTDGGFSKLVALKVLNSDMEGMAEMAMRMRDEARVLGLVNHRAIVQVDALVLLDGKWTVVMEYVEGSDAKALMGRGPIPLGPALEVTRELGSALDFAFNAAGPDGLPLKLVHRDIKPGNVRITPGGEVKLLDFGIARADFQSREARTRSLSFGTPDYMAPERFEFVDGPEGDVYAVGVLFYEMLTGEHFGQTSPAQERHDARVMAALDKLWQATGGKSEELVRFVGTMLAFDPAARPTAREVERRCTELWRTHGELSLRDWVEQVLPTITQTEEEAAPNDLTSRKLTENIRSGAIPYPTEKLELPDPPAAPPPVQPPPVSTAAGAPVPEYEAHDDYAPAPKKGGSGMWILLALFLFLVLGSGAGLAGWYAYKKLGSDDGGDWTDGTVAGQEAGGEEGGGEGSSDPTTTSANTGNTDATTTTGTTGSTDATTTSANTGSTDATTTTGTTTTGTTTTGTTTTGTTDATTTSANTGGTDATTTTGTTGTTASTGKTDATTTEKTDEKTEGKETTTSGSAQKTGKVVVVGDARVRLNRGGTSIAPSNAVPVGTYALEYTIPGQPTQKGGRVVVTAGKTVNIACSRGTKTCTVR